MGVKHAHQTALPNRSSSDVSATAWNDDHTIDDNSIPPAKLAISATDRLIGRQSAGAGAGEEIALTSFGRALIGASSAAAQRAALDALMGLTPTAVKTAAYTAAAGDFVPVDTTGGAVTITLPTAPADLTVIGVKHIIQGGANAVTVQRGGADVFNKAGGSTALSLSRVLSSFVLLYKASTGIWYVVATDPALVASTDFYAPGGTDVAVADGGTGASTAAAARTNLGLGTVATAALDTDGTLAANSDTNVPSQKAVKTAIANAVTGLLDWKGSTDCSGNPNYPAASKGDAYIVSVAGKIGGASGLSVDVGDVYFATADNAGGTQASVGASWDVLEHNLVGALLAANNLSDLASAATARTNLGLGTFATKSTLAAGDVADNTLAIARIAAAATSRIFGRKTAGAGAGEELSAADVATIIGPTIKLGNIYVAAGAMLPAITNGATGPSQIERATNGENFVVMDFPDAATKYALFSLDMPTDYDGGTFTCEFEWTNANANTLVVKWQIEARMYADGTTLDSAWGTAVTVTDANQNTAYQFLRSAATAAVTAASAAAGGLRMVCRIARLGADAADTLTSDARLLGVRIVYTRA